MAKGNRFLNNERGDIGEIVAAVVGLLIIVIAGMMMGYVGSELEDAAGLSYNAAGGGNTKWDNITGETGDAAESGMNIVAVGVILTILLAAVGVFVYPYIEKLT